MQFCFTYHAATVLAATHQQVIGQPCRSVYARNLGGYCNVTQDSNTHTAPNCTQNLDDTPETKCKVLKLTLYKYT